MSWKSLQLYIHDIDTSRGGKMSVYVFLKDGFPIQHNKSIKQYHFDINETSHLVSIDVPEGEFAIKLHHDEDRSGNVTKNWTGIFPAEGLAFSSGAKLRFGPPSFTQAKMHFPIEGETHIHMIYP